MPYIVPKCKICSKDVKVKSTFNIGGTIMLSLECGHQIKNDQIVQKSYETLRSLRNDKLMPFQVESAHFIEGANGRAMLLHEMGLGKTVIGLAFLAQNPDELPVVVVGKGSLATQWQRMFANWVSSDREAGYKFMQIISSSKDIVLPGLPGYFVSYDLIRRFDDKNAKDRTGHVPNRLVKMFEERGVKTLIIDECQQIKNNEAERTHGVRELARICKNVIPMSGTPIKNHAGEFFPSLNMCQPDRYPKYAWFLRDDVNSAWNGYGNKVGGLKDPEYFQKKNSDFIIRKTRQEVLPELPAISHQYMFNELGGKVEQAYIDEFKKFRNDFNSMGDKKDFSDNGHILAYLSRMRHLTGYAKIDPCLDFCAEFLASTDDERLCIFVHHIDVAELLQRKLAELCKALQFDWEPMNLVSLNPSVRERKKDEWIVSKSRILILSTLASGEGLDGLQTVCHKMVQLEREWNPANEDQVEGRFSRIGHMKTLENKVDNTFFIAVGTVDEFFSEIVERKREIVGSALDGKAVAWDQTSIIMELAEVLAMNGGKKWGI